MAEWIIFNKTLVFCVSRWLLVMQQISSAAKWSQSLENSLNCLKEMGGAQQFLLLEGNCLQSQFKLVFGTVLSHNNHFSSMLP
jgi:hypothetical protein